jgi:hypothetical protein
MMSSQIRAAEWVSNWVDGPATATYERIGDTLRTYVNMPAQGGHAQFTLNTEPPTTTGGSYFSGAVAGANAAVAAKTSIPFQTATGAAVAASATVTAAVLKPNLAKAAAFLVRANPYVSAALTLGWLANAGYQYATNNSTFTQAAPTTTATFNTAYVADFCASHGITECCTVPDRFKVSDPYIGTSNVAAKWTNGTIYAGYTKQYVGYSHEITGQPLEFVQCGWPLSTAQQQAAQQCTAGYSYSNGDCVPGSTVPRVTVTPEQVETGLATSAMTPAGDTNAAKTGIVDELLKGGVLPVTEPATLTGPATVPAGQTTTTRPDGTVETTSKTYQNTYNNNYVDTKTTIITTVTPANGTPIVTTSTQTPDTAQPQADSKSDCDKYPDAVGCLKVGVVPLPDPIPTVTAQANLSPVSLGAGSCPAPKTIVLHFQTLSMSYQPYCDFASMLKPLVVAFAWLSAGFLVLGSVRE